MTYRPDPSSAQAAAVPDTADPTAPAADPTADPTAPAADPTADPTAVPSRWQGLYDLLATIDSDIESLYTDRGIHGVRPRFAYALIRLAHSGPVTIRELATSLSRTHSATSQTVAAMRREGLVQSEPGADARTRYIALTERGHELIPFVEAEWRATEAAVTELDDEVPHALSAVARELERALERRPMRERLQAHLVPPPAGQEPDQPPEPRPTTPS